MSNSGYTPEPWIKDKTHQVRQMYGTPPHFHEVILDEADYDRALKCVNACESFVNPEEAIQALKSDVCKLQAEREKLINFVKNVADYAQNRVFKIEAKMLLKESGAHL